MSPDSGRMRGMLRPQHSGSRVTVYASIALALIFLIGIYNYHGLSNQKHSLYQKVLDAETKLSATEKEISELQTELHSLKSSSGAMKDQVKRDSDKYKLLEEEKEKCEQANLQLKAEVDELKGKESNADDSMRTLTSKLDTCNAKVSELSNSILECEKQLSAFSQKEVNGNESHRKPLNTLENKLADINITDPKRGPVFPEFPVNRDKDHGLGAELAVNQNEIGINDSALDVKLKDEPDEKRVLESADHIDVADNKIDIVEDTDNVRHRAAPLLPQIDSQKAGHKTAPIGNEVDFP